MNRIVTILSLSILLIVCHTAAARADFITLGHYFDPDGHRLDGRPPSFTLFETYLILKDADYSVTGVEFQLLTPDDPSHARLILIEFSFPQENTLCLGDPFSGMAIVYWPPLNGFAEDHLLLLTLQWFLIDPCFCDDGTVMDYPIVVAAHPESGELRGTYAPDHELFSIIGLTSILCPYYWPPLLVNVIVMDDDEIQAVFGGLINEWSAEHESSYLVIEHTSPPDTLTVVNASQYSDVSTILTLERPMIDGTLYTLLATHICDILYICGDSQFDFQYDISIGTLLQNFSARLNGTEIEITWRMAEIDEGVDFRVLRAAGDHGQFADTPSPAIMREGLEFRLIDRNVEPGRTYRYRIEYIEDGEDYTLFETEPIEIPAMPLTLYQNVPNPFNPVTTIRYHLPEPCHITLDIFDIGGKRIVRLVDRIESSGYREVQWHGLDETGNAVTSGLYFYRLTAGKATFSKKMLLLK